ncbi:MAG TPA: LysR family transcriptional regulator [Polyangiaceae bacterium]|nr:LysR family transcriptional regulator [Polyangiaceae bacterium]
MEWLNYHHLYYFSVIAREGGVAPAARKLKLTHSTLSAQLRALEVHFGAPLFERRGKRLVLTAFGADAAAYAADIFRLGRELNDVAKGRGAATRGALRIGVVAGMPKTLVNHLLGPVLDGPDFAVALRQDDPGRLLEALSGGGLHLVLTNDVPTAPPGATLHTHPLGETDILLFASRALARRVGAAFPASLGSVPFILPLPGSPFRRRLDAWFARHGLAVRAKVEVDDAGLLRALGVAGRGVFPVRSALRAEIEDLRGLEEIGACDGVSEPYFAVTTERRVRHPGVSAIIDIARSELNVAPPR